MIRAIRNIFLALVCPAHKTALTLYSKLSRKWAVIGIWVWGSLLFSQESGIGKIQLNAMEC
jgi:hypothetical protein